MDTIEEEEQAASDLGESRRRLGVKLKLARQTKNLTLRELADRSQCSESLLSKIENGKALPSLPLVHRLVRVLETNISWLFEETAPDASPVYRAGERPVITLERKRGGGGVSFERIIPFKSGHLLQCNIHHVEVGGQSGEAITHEGEEVGYVLQGKVELTIDGETYALKAGDAFCFRSNMPHLYRNVGKERASILWVCTPPTF
jgi:transcriptional regulator with XRE-family HTH domain